MDRCKMEQIMAPRNAAAGEAEERIRHPQTVDQILLTMMWSPMSSVGSIEPEGIL